MWFDRAVGLARRLTGRDESFCLDVVQEAMLKVARKARAVGGDAEAEAWMTRVVHTAALDLLRRESRRAGRERGRASGGAAAGDGVVLGERIEWLRAEVARLEVADRALLAARFGKGRTLEEAGASAGMSGAAAHGRIRRAIARLRESAKEVFRE